MGEYAKWLWYQNATDIVQNRLYLFTEKVHRLKMWERDGVEYAVCDSPLPLNIIYNNTPEELFDKSVMHEYVNFDNYTKEFSIYVRCNNDSSWILLENIFLLEVRVMVFPRISCISCIFYSVYRVIKLYWYIFRKCIWGNKAIEHLSEKAARIERWADLSYEIYLFNCMMMIMVLFISGDLFYKDIKFIQKLDFEKTSIDPAYIIMYMIGLLIAPSVIALVLNWTHKLVYKTRINIKYKMSQICFYSTIWILFLPFDLLLHGILNMFPIELYGRMLYRGILGGYEKGLLWTSVICVIMLLLGCAIWWYRIIKESNGKWKYYLVSTVMIACYTIGMPFLLNASNIILRSFQSYGTIDRLERLIVKANEGDERTFRLLYEYIDYDDNLSEEDKRRVKVIALLSHIEMEVDDRNVKNVYMYVKEDKYEKAKEVLVNIPKEKLAEHIMEREAVERYLTELIKSGDNKTDKEKNKKSINIAIFSPVFTIFPFV